MCMGKVSVYLGIVLLEYVVCTEFSVLLTCYLTLHVDTYSCKET